MEKSKGFLSGKNSKEQDFLPSLKIGNENGRHDRSIRRLKIKESLNYRR